MSFFNRRFTVSTALAALTLGAASATVPIVPPSQADIESVENEISSVFGSRMTRQTQPFRGLTPASAEDTSAETPLPAPVAHIKAGEVRHTDAPRRLKAAKAPELPVNNEKYYSADRVLGSSDINTYTITFSVTGTTTKTYKVKGVYGQTSTLTVTFGADGSAEIAAQKFITNNTTYGNIWFCPVDLAAGTYSLTDPVKCTRDEAGNWEMGPWALVVNHTTDKGYNGAVLFASEGSRWFVPNMTASFQTEDSSGNVKDNSFQGAWYQDDSSGLYLLNMGNTGAGRAVNLRLTPQKTGVLSPQFVSSAGGYGTLYAYYADYSTGQAAPAKSASCTVTDEGSLVFRDLIIATRTISSASNIRIAAAPITYALTGDALRFPDPVDVGFDGSGTAADPYRITRAEDFRALAAAMSMPGYASASYKVMNDIDLSALKDFTPTGDDTTPFNGTFDGNSKKLTGLTYNGFGFTYTGLFGVLGPKATVKDLALDGFTMYSAGPNTGLVAAYNAGGTVSGVTVTRSLLQTRSEVAGGITGMSSGKITGCRVAATVEGYGASGGIAGYNCGEIADCHYSGEMSMLGALSTSYRHIAGIAAQTLSAASSGLKGYIHDCTVSGTITDDYGYAYVGGITAVSHGSKTEDPSVIERCASVATLSCAGLDYTSDATLPKSYCGGIAAYISSSAISDCANGGLIIETSRPKVFTGGVVGIASVSFISGAGGSRLGNLSSVNRCLALGQIHSSVPVGSGVFGAVPVVDSYDPAEVAAQIFKDCYADNQINRMTDATYGMSTAALASGTLPSAFSSTVWSASAGLYPVPASLKGNEAATLLAAPAILAAGENYSNVKKDFTLGGAASVKWGILGAGGTTTASTPSLSVSGTSAVIGSSYGNDWLVASQGAAVKMLQVCVVPKVFDGDGTAESPFLIKDIADMAVLNDAVVKYGQSHRGDFFRITADIDASADPSFVCVGYPVMGLPFNGTFDGAGHAFRKLAVKTAFRTASGGVTASKSYQYGGLFSHLGEDGTIRNVVIAADCEYDVYNMSGAIAGISFGTVEGCRNYARIGSNGMATGGIVGENDGTVTGCYNAGTVEVQQSGIKTGAGGIVGANTGLIDLCQNDGDVTISDKKTAEVSGGIAAINYGKIDRSINFGAVTANAKAGGITATLGAAAQTAEITRSANFATVTTVKDASNGAVANDVRLYKVSDVVYDASLTTVGASLNPLAGCTGMSTADLVDGSAPAGLDAASLDLAQGKYPVLKAFAAEPRAGLLRSTYIDFVTGQSVANLSADATLASPQEVSWTVDGNEAFAIEGSVLKVTVPSGDLSAKATVTASADGAAVKTYPVASLPILFDGKGTADAPYLIKTKEDLNTLSGFISKNAYDCLNMHYRLEADIAYAEGDEFAPVGGDGTTKFNGSFDGNGRSVSGIVYSSTTAKPGKNTGLFGQVGPQGTIHDLEVANTITGYGAGGVAAQLEGEIYNCVNRGTVVGTGDPAGGIVGTIKTGARVHDCTNLGAVMSEKTYGTGGIAGKMEKESVLADCVNKGAVGGEKQGKALGGIVGLAGGSITGCHNEGTLATATASAGGIVGKHLSGALLEISDCHNLAEINAPKAVAVAGILGGNDSDKSLNKAQVHVTGCHNEGKITATIGVGGLLGIVSESDFTMTGCHNTADIEALNLGAKGFADTFAGGLAGCVNGSAVEGTDIFIRDCHNSGNVTAWGGNNIGGLTGKNGAPIQSCYNTGAVRATFDGTGLDDLTGFSLSSIGGISGSAYGSVTGSWNSGAVHTDGCWVGGIAGYTNKDIVGCANIADITGVAGMIAGGSDTQAVAGIVGRMGSVSYAGFITDCYNSGAIEGLTQVAGIVAQRFGNEAQIGNVYNAGTVKATLEGGSAFAIGNQRTDGAEALPSDARVYYLDGCCAPASALDDAATAISRDGLSEAPLGEAFINAPGALPVLAALYEPAPTYLDAVYGLAFGNAGDTPEAVTGLIHYAELPGLSWTASANISLSDGTALSTDTGAGWLRVALETDDSAARTFDVDIKVAAGLVDISAEGAEILSSLYFDLYGRRLDAPAPGSVCVRRDTFTDGTTATSTVLVK